MEYRIHENIDQIPVRIVGLKEHHSISGSIVTSTSALSPRAVLTGVGNAHQYVIFARRPDFFVYDIFGREQTRLHSDALGGQLKTGPIDPPDFTCVPQGI